jgi:hypothetical protein
LRGADAVIVLPFRPNHARANVRVSRLKVLVQDGIGV